MNLQPLEFISIYGELTGLLRNYLKTAFALGGALRQAQGERITRFVPLTVSLSNRVLR